MSEKLICILMVLVDFVASKRRNKYTGRESKKNPKYQSQELDDILRRYWPQDVKFYIDPYYFFRLVLAVHLFWGLRHFGMCLFMRNYSSTLQGALKNF